MKVAYVFSTSAHTASYKLGKMILRGPRGLFPGPLHGAGRKHAGPGDYSVIACLLPERSRRGRA